MLSLSEWVHKKKPDLKPYTNQDDSRLEVSTLYVAAQSMWLILFCSVWWLEKDFLKYIDDWSKEIEDSDFEPKEKKKMGLSIPTIEGLQITG